MITKAYTSERGKRRIRMGLSKGKLTFIMERPCLLIKVRQFYQPLSAQRRDESRARLRRLFPDEIAVRRFPEGYRSQRRKTAPSYDILLIMAKAIVENPARHPESPHLTDFRGQQRMVNASEIIPAYK